MKVHPAESQHLGVHVQTCADVTRHTPDSTVWWRVSVLQVLDCTVDMVESVQALHSLYNIR